MMSFGSVLIFEPVLELCGGDSQNPIGFDNDMMGNIYPKFSLSQG